MVQALVWNVGTPRPLSCLLKHQAGRRSRCVGRCGGWRGDWCRRRVMLQRCGGRHGGPGEVSLMCDERSWCRSPRSPATGVMSRLEWPRWRCREACSGKSSTSSMGCGWPFAAMTALDPRDSGPPDGEAMPRECRGVLSRHENGDVNGESGLICSLPRHEVFQTLSNNV